MPWLTQWLGGKALYAVLVTCALVLVSPVLAAIIVFLRCLKFGVVDALVVAALGLISAVLVAIPAAEVFNGIQQPMDLLELTAKTFGGAIALALWQQRVGSLTLCLQSILVLAIAAIFGLHLFAIAPEVLWQAELDAMQRQFVHVENIEELMSTVVWPMAHAIGIGAIWFAGVWIVGIGTALYNQLSQTATFGRFSDLSLGKVLARAMVFVCVLLPWLPIPVVTAVALFMFLAFVVPGVALVHWVVKHRGHPATLALVVYVLLLVPVVNALTMISLALVGYIDAWFDIRSRVLRSNS